MCISMPGLAGTLRVESVGAALREPRVTVWLVVERRATREGLSSEIVGNVMIEGWILVGTMTLVQ